MKIISTVILGSLIAVGLLSFPVQGTYTTADWVDRKLNDLEYRLKKLERENKLLTKEIKGLQELVYQKFNIEGTDKAPDIKGDNKKDCLKYIDNLEAQLADLKIKGVKDKHPYVVTINNKIKKQKEECATYKD